MHIWTHMTSKVIIYIYTNYIIQYISIHVFLCFRSVATHVNLHKAQAKAKADYTCSTIAREGENTGKLAQNIIR